MTGKINLAQLRKLPAETKLAVVGGIPTTAKQVLAFINNGHFGDDHQREDYLTAKGYQIVH